MLNIEVVLQAQRRAVTLMRLTMKHVFGCFCALILGALSPSAALAEEWTFVDIDGDGAAYFYDAESLKVNENFAAVWVMWDHTRDKTVKKRATKDKWILGCRDETITIVYTASYGKNGNVINSTSFPDYMRETNPIVPGSVADRIAKLVCRKY